MGVVHEHREGLAGVDRLEPPGNARDGRDPGPHGVVRHLQHLGERDRAQHVLDVEPAAQADVERQRPARRRRDQRDDAARADLDGMRAHVGLVAGAGVRQAPARRPPPASRRP